MNETLLNKIRECSNLPSLPTIAMQVLELAKKSDVDIAEIARIISKDPALSGKLLKTVNSSFYGRSQHVSTISHALVILGLQSVKTLVLGFSLVTNLKKGNGRGFKYMEYWKRSIYAATAARSIAAKANFVQQEEAFLAALLMDIGMLVFDQVLGDAYGEVNAKIHSHQELAALESSELGGNHAEVGGVLAESWKLPPLLATPIQYHHQTEAVTDEALKKLTEVVYLGGRCADVFVDENAAPAIADVHRQFAQSMGWSDADTDALLAEIGTRTREAASLFEINIGSPINYEAILKHAKETLVDITLQSQMQVNQLTEQNVELKRAATTDGLTGLANRACFDQFVSEQFTAAMKSGKPLSLLMLDVDKFKSINDKYGHPVGDQVLKALAKVLKAAVRPCDLASRFGGEEMTLVLPGATKATAANVAERLRQAIAAKPITSGTTSVPVTASIGVATLEPGGPFRVVAHLIKAADLAVYAAKKSGRNCVRVFTLPRPASKAA